MDDTAFIATMFIDYLYILLKLGRCLTWFVLIQYLASISHHIVDGTRSCELALPHLIFILLIVRLY